MMQYKQINGVSKPVARLVQGTVMFSDDKREENQELLDALFEQGFTTFDTAHGYGRGACERILGDWIQKRGIRDKLVIIDKGAHPYEGFPKRVAPEFIRADLQESLERLQTDFIDIYLLHRDNPEVPVGPIVEVLNEAHQKGQIGIFGGSNWSAERVKEANDYAKAHNLVPFQLSSPQFSVADMVKEPWAGCISVSANQGKAERAWYAANNIPLFTWSSLAGGFMTGRFRRDNLDSFDQYFDTVTVNAYCYEDNFRRLDRVQELAEDKGVTIPQISLAYLLNQPQSVFPIIACWTADQIPDNLGALDVNLSPAEIKWLELKTEEKPS